MNSICWAVILLSLTGVPERCFMTNPLSYPEHEGDGLPVTAMRVAGSMAAHFCDSFILIPLPVIVHEQRQAFYPIT